MLKFSPRRECTSETDCQPAAQPQLNKLRPKKCKSSPGRQLAEAAIGLLASSPAAAEQAEVQEKEEQPRKRERRSGPSTSEPGIPAEEDTTVASDAEAVAVDGGVTLGSAGEEDWSQHVCWGAAHGLRALAIHQTFFFSLAPLVADQTTQTAAVLRAGMSEAEVTCQFAQEGRAGAGSEAD